MSFDDAFRLNFSKAIQAVGVILRTTPERRMNYMKLLKLLYLADRASLKETGAPITGDRVVAMARGPVLSEIYNLIKGEHVRAARWDRFVHRDGYHVTLAENTSVRSLSRFEIATLHETAQKFRDCDEWDMVQFCHSLPEWKKNEPGESSRPISLHDILESVDRLDDEAAIVEEARHCEAIDRFFAENRGPR